MTNFTPYIYLCLLLVSLSCKAPKTQEKILLDTLKGNNKTTQKDKIKEAPKTFINNKKENIPDEINNFIPEGYKLLNITKGNLNLDSLDDAIILIGKADEESKSTRVDPIPRLVNILIGNSNGNLTMVSQSENATYPYGFDLNFNDCFSGIVIKKGFFSIEHYGGFNPRWSRVTTFKFSKDANDWYLHRDGFGNFDPIEQKEGPERIYTKDDFGKVSFKEFDIFSHE